MAHKQYMNGMKVYFCHARDFDYQNDLYKPIRESELNTQYDIIFPHEDGAPAFKSKEVIKECGVVLAEVSFPATGLGIELGWADMYGVPIICFYKRGSKVSGSLQYLTDDIVEYSDARDLVEKVYSALSSSSQKEDEGK